MNYPFYQIIRWDNETTNVVVSELPINDVEYQPPPIEQEYKYVVVNESGLNIRSSMDTNKDNVIGFAGNLEILEGGGYLQSEQDKDYIWIRLNGEQERYCAAYSTKTNWIGLSIYTDDIQTCLNELTGEINIENGHLVIGNQKQNIGANGREYLYLDADQEFINNGCSFSTVEKQLTRINYNINEHNLNFEPWYGKLVRVYLPHRNFSITSTINQLRNFALACQKRNIKIVLVLSDALNSKNIIPGDEKFHTDGYYGHLNMNFYNGGYQENYLPFITEVLNTIMYEPNIFKNIALIELLNEPQLFSPTEEQSFRFRDFVNHVSNEIYKITHGRFPISIGHQDVCAVSPDNQRDTFGYKLYSREDGKMRSIHFVSIHQYSPVDFGNGPIDIWENEDAKQITISVANEYGLPFGYTELMTRYENKQGIHQYDIMNAKLNDVFDSSASMVLFWALADVSYDMGFGDKERGADWYYNNAMPVLNNLFIDIGKHLQSN